MELPHMVITAIVVDASGTHDYEGKDVAKLVDHRCQLLCRRCHLIP